MEGEMQRSSDICRSHSQLSMEILDEMEKHEVRTGRWCDESNPKGNGSKGNCVWACTAVDKKRMSGTGCKLDQSDTLPALKVIPRMSPQLLAAL